MRWMILLCLVSIFTRSSAVLSAPVPADQKPDQEISWKGISMTYNGSAGPHLYGLAAKSGVLEVWTWTDGTMKRSYQSKDEWPCAVAYAKGCYFSVPMEKPAILMEETRNERILKEWALGQDSYCNRLSPSCNGEFIAAAAIAKGADMDHPHQRIGLITVKTKDILWLPDLVGGPFHCTFNSLVPSDDGMRIAGAGWDNGAIVWDTSTKKVLWQSKLKDEAHAVAAAFSPDRKRLYVGGAAAVVHILETDTGKYIGQMKTDRLSIFSSPWVSAIALSPDGRFVAAGTGPWGQVWIWRTEDWKQVALLNHGKSHIRNLMFSPDSKTLVTAGGDHIKIWKIPQP